MSAGQARAYTRCDDADIVRRALDGLTLIYHRPSGLTHMLASPLPEIMAALNDAPLSPAALLDRLAADYDLGEEADALSTLEAHLEELAALGLIGSALCATA